MITHDYANLDAAILAAIESHQPITFSTLCVMPGVKQESETLSAAQQRQTAGRALKEPFRFIDARLQSLRKAGKVEPVGGKFGWRLKK